jgi:SAM-dependent methyltransferase
MLRLVAGLNGVPAPPDEDFDYCELGAGNGDTLATLAAANPSARFVGVDFNPEHVAFATALANRGGLSNVRFLERDFEDLDKEDLPLFDFIGAHGILSWVSAAKRKAIVAFAASRLKPGGLFYVSYNALPGWAAVEPLRRLMLNHSATVAGATLDRAREGFRFAQHFAEAGAGYFANHPTAKSMLALMQKGGLSYVVHEYFHAHWQPMYFADLAHEMAASDLGFVGQMPLYLNIRDLAIPPALKEVAKSAVDRIAFETLKDFAVNELFRSDVFIKGKATRSEQEMRFYFEGTPFGTMAVGAQIKREVRLPIYTLNFKEPIYDAVLGAISEGATTAMELAQRPKLLQFGQSRIGDCLQNLVLGSQVVPMRSAPRAAPTRQYRLTLAHNHHVLEQALKGDAPLVLASPATTTGVTVSLVEAIALVLLTEVNPGDHASFVRSFVQQRGGAVKVGDRAIKDASELVKLVSHELEALRSSGLPKLFELGILENVAP